MATTKPLVLVLGATGYTGKSVVDGLLSSGNFRLAAMVRPLSLAKPAVEELRAAGIEIRPGDITDPEEELKKVLVGVDILISLVQGFIVPAQRAILQAAKDVGVRRVVPCDFATPGSRGVRELHDSKLAIRDFVLELGLGYTFIDVGWWMQLFLPLPVRTPIPEKVKRDFSWTVWGDGNTPLLLTDARRIGAYVARIIADERTLNKAVIVWEDEVTTNEAMALGDRYSGEADALRAKRVYVSEQELIKAREAAHEAFAKDPQDINNLMQTALTDYMYSLHVLKENTLVSAKKLGYLDVHELYPDLPRYKFEDFAKEFYAMENPGELYLRDSMREIFEKM